MDAQIRWTLIACAVAIPYAAEILWQVPLLMRVMGALPAAVRQTLPRHPRRPAWAIFGSARFFLALFRWAMRDHPGEGPVLVGLKRQMRASALREALFGTALAVVLVLAWRDGWRPALLFEPSGGAAAVQSHPGRERMRRPLPGGDRGQGRQPQRGEPREPG